MSKIDYPKEYREQVKAGLIDPPKKLDPIEKAKQNTTSRKLAIADKCWDCCCYSKDEFKKCQSIDCPLHNLRPWQEKKNEQG